MNERVPLGAVIAAHGIKGEVRVKTFTSRPEAISAYGPLSTEAGRELVIKTLKPSKGDEVIVRFEGITARDEAEKLKGQQLFVARASLPEPEAGEFYHADLIGLKVEDREGNLLGKIAALHNFGAGDVIELEFLNGKMEFVPFAADVVLEIDIANRRMVIAPPRYEG